MLAEKGAHVYDRLLTPGRRRTAAPRRIPPRASPARLATKEAVYKALQGSPAARGIGWREIEVVRDEDGRPDVVLAGLAAQRAGELGVTRIFVSLSHTHAAAVATAVVEAL